MFYPIKPPKSVTMDSGLCLFLDCGINSCVARFFVFVLFCLAILRGGVRRAILNLVFLD